MKPFIKLFRSPRGYYFFDVNRNMICTVDKDTFFDLKNILEGNNIICSKKIDELKANGWLSEKRPLSMLHHLTDKAEYWLEHNVQQLVLQVTQACNLTCIYCPYAINTNKKYSRSHSSKTMSYDVAKKAIDFLYDKSDNLNDISISFYGGEPLISFELIKSCVKYADKLFDGKKISYSITTNATLLTDEILDFLADKKFFITFSVDGPKSIHDKHRLRGDGSPTYDIVVKNLTKAVSRYGDFATDHILINMVINPIDSIDEIIEWINEPLFESIIINTSFVEDDLLEKKFIEDDSFLSKYNYHKMLRMLDNLYLVKGIKPNKLFDSSIKEINSDYIRFRNDAVELPDINSPSGPCLSGSRKIFVNVDGNIYPCERVNELSPSMLIGTVNTDFDYQQIKRHLNIAQLTPDSCKNCFAQNHCNICQRHADDGEKLSGVNKNKACVNSINSLISKLITCTMINERRMLYNLQEEKQ